MARFNKGVQGGYSGKMGNVVGSSWRQIDYIRSLPRLKKNRTITEKQLAQRMRFAMAVNFLAPLKDVMNIGFRDRSQGRATGYNIGLKRFLTETIIGEYPDYQVDYSNLVLSTGSVGPLLGPKLEPITNGGVLMTWTPIQGGGAQLHDEVIVAVYNREKQFVLVLEEHQRSDAEVLIPVPDVFVSDTLEVFTFLVKRNVNACSKSQHVGSIVVTADMVGGDVLPEPED